MFLLVIIAAGRGGEVAEFAAGGFLVSLLLTVGAHRLAARLARATHVAVSEIETSATARLLVSELRRRQGFLTVGQCIEIRRFTQGPAGRDVGV